MQRILRKAVACAPSAYLHCRLTSVHTRARSFRAATFFTSAASWGGYSRATTSSPTTSRAQCAVARCTCSSQATRRKGCSGCSPTSFDVGNSLLTEPAYRCVTNSEVFFKIKLLFFGNFDPIIIFF